MIKSPQLDSISVNTQETEYVTMSELQSNPDKFFTIWQSLSHNIYRYCTYKFGLTHWDAEDLTSDTMLKAYDNFAYANQKSNIKGWIYLLARNIYFDQLKRSRRKLGYKKELLLNHDIDEDEPFTHNADLKAINIVKKVINKLTDKNRTVSFDFFFNESDYQELSIKYNIPPHQVRQRIHRVRAKIQSHLKII